MKKINNSGFTILEMIIAMSILTVVIFIGYGVINGSNKAINGQRDTSNEQLSVNLINKYITKDIEILEAKKNIEVKNNNVNVDSHSNKYIQNYTYTIDTVNYDEGGSVVDKVEYEVKHEGEIRDNKLNGIYSVNRKSKKEDGNIISNLDLIINQKTMYTKDSSVDIEEFLENNLKPFIINKNNPNMNLYTVGIDYESNNKKKNYEFDVSPRISLSKEDSQLGDGQPEEDSSPEIVDLDMEPQSNNVQNGYIKFAYTQDEKVYREIGYSKLIEPGKYETNIINQDEIYKNRTELEHGICAEFSPGNANGYAEVTNMTPEYKEALDGSNQSAFPKMNVDLVDIIVVGDTSTVITVLTNRSGNKFNPEYENVKINTGKQIFKLNESSGQGDKIKNIKIEGKSILNKHDGKGEVIITFGKSKTT